MTTPEQQIIYDLILKAWTNGKVQKKAHYC